MKRITFWGFMALVCCIFSAPVHCLASDGMQPFVLVTDRNGSSNFSMSNGDGTLTAQQALVRYDDDGDETYCNGIGDFDNDGELDLIIATGSGGGIVYHFGNMVNNEFVPKGQMNGPVDRFNVGYPANMALADFNEDNNLDFIVTYDGSQDCDLFMGNGNMEFTLKELPGTAPWSAIGADAGDFNGDGHTDFVVVSDSESPSVYINLGSVEGTFDTVTEYLPNSISVAAADFNGDGLDDLALSFTAYWIYIYPSTIDANGNLSFDSPIYVIDPKLNYSPIDAYDFDGDGEPDLVVGSYRTTGNKYTDIAVMLGTGGGQFEDAVAYGGAPDLDSITAISTPTPFQPEIISNTAPVAEISCDSPEVLVGQTVYVYVDEEGTYDPDGEIVSYVWDFGDGTTAEVLETQRAYSASVEGLELEHVYRQTGTFNITLTVTDDQGAEGRAVFPVEVFAIKARMRVFPRVLNLDSRLRWMYSVVKLPEGCDVTPEVEVNGISVIDEGNSPHPVNLNNGNHSLVIRTPKWLARHNRFYIKFSRQATIDAINATHASSNQATIRVNGKAYCNGGDAEFSADDTIRTIKRNKKKSYKWKRKNRRGPIRKR